MQPARAKAAEAQGRKAKLAHSYQQLLSEFSNTDLKSVGNYTLGRMIGKGSFGKVYLATHKLTNGSKVVLKQTRKDDANLAREIHHHRQFVHPHIARLYEVIVTESMVWLVLEYCPGDELYRLIEQGKLPVDKVQRIFAQLIGAVSYVHRQSCVHRDLKLENILLDKHENVKLCDFGFTRDYEGKASYLQTYCGTVCYAAPEMLKGEKYAGEKIDVWSCGVILYALLCGELPFDNDDESMTRTRILTEEPGFPDQLPPEAVALCKRLLSKRPLHRPSLPEILADAFLAEYAPQQQEMLKLTQPAPFTTPLEQETMQRMRSAGLDTESVMESVLGQRCDALAGWWTLLIEKERRKARRRERKRREREAENRVSRRFSQASTRLTALATVDEDVLVKLSEPPPPSKKRLSGCAPSLTTAGSRPRSPQEAPPLDKESLLPANLSTQRRPIPPPKEGVLRSARSRGSTLHFVTTGKALDRPQPDTPPNHRVKKRPSQAILAHLQNWTHWLLDSTRRHRPSHKRGHSTPNLADKASGAKDLRTKDVSPRPHTGKEPATAAAAAAASLLKGVVANGSARATAASLSPASTLHSPTTPLESANVPVRVPNTSSYKRQSLSPAPLTPHSSMRRSSGPAGLRGRTSTSSSVSSIRSMVPAHHHSHSKTSSTSSNGSVSKTPMLPGRSPHHSVKVLPATPTTPHGFPSHLRLARDRNGPAFKIVDEVKEAGEAGHGDGLSFLTLSGPAPLAGVPSGSLSPFGSFGGGIMFAKRKKNLFKGPMLSLVRDKGGPGGASLSHPHSHVHSRSASASGLGRRSGEITIQEEDEDDDDGEDIRETIEGNDEVEEVDVFSPIVGGPGETVEEQIIEDGEDKTTLATDDSTQEKGKQREGSEPDPLPFELQPPAEVVPAR